MDPNQPVCAHLRLLRLLRRSIVPSPACYVGRASAVATCLPDRVAFSLTLYERAGVGLLFAKPFIRQSRFRSTMLLPVCPDYQARGGLLITRRRGTSRACRVSMAQSCLSWYVHADSHTPDTMRGALLNSWYPDSFLPTSVAQGGAHRLCASSPSFAAHLMTALDVVAP